MRKNQILGAARELLADNGIAGTSMNQIAERAELSVGTVYIYFKNKEDLYASLQEEGLDLLYDSITKAVEKGGTP
ncbi:MAG: helix-turn-helix transcriptional regulator, partial [Deltaproteobacteria bacterium]|nr:helix-turn-helix transcriptional regulator [Deltaproteobacteria bacterium]